MKSYHEQQEQTAVANYLRCLRPDGDSILFTINAYNSPSARAGARVKASGYDVGCPDIMIFEPRTVADEGHFYGLFIELKRSAIYGGHKVSKEQKEWIEALKVRGYLAVVCVGAQEAYKAIDKYFGVK